MKNINDENFILSIINKLQTEIDDGMNNIIVSNIIIKSIKESYNYININDVSLKYKINGTEDELENSYRLLKNNISYENKRLYKIEKEILILKQYLIILGNTYTLN